MALGSRMMKVFAVVALVLVVGIAACTLEEQVKVEDAVRHLKELQRIANENNNNRAAGKPGHVASTEYIYNQLVKNGDFDITIQEFEFNSWMLDAHPVLAQVSPVQSFFSYGNDFSVFKGSAPAVIENTVVTAVSNLGCSAEDYADFPRGNIAIVMRGECSFSEKATLAENAGAVALLIYNYEEAGVVFSGRVQDVSIPVFSMSYSLGSDLAAMSNLRLAITVQATMAKIKTTNLLADVKSGDPDRIIVMGSHLDSVPAGPGINDNGSGSAASLVLALATKCLNPKLRLRFAWWGAEEHGLIGSTFYVNDLKKNNPAELAKIKANINVDMIASPNFYYGIYAGSTAPPAIRNQSALIEKTFQDALERLGCPHQPTPFDGRSDYGPFIQNGIPAGGVFTGAEKYKTAEEQKKYGGVAGEPYDKCYHRACDNIENINVEAFHNMLKSVAAVLDMLISDEQIQNQLERPTPFSEKPMFYHTDSNAISIL